MSSVITVLTVTNPFSIDLASSLGSKYLYITGGSIKNIATKETYVVHEKAKLSLPNIINYIYYNIKMKKYVIFKEDKFENNEYKLLFEVELNLDKTIKTTRNIFLNDIPVDVDDITAGIVAKNGTLKTNREENIVLLAAEGKQIVLKNAPVEIISIAIEYRYNGELIPFGTLDLENIDTLVLNIINLKLNLVRFVSKSMGFIVDELQLDVTYTY